MELEVHNYRSLSYTLQTTDTSYRPMELCGYGMPTNTDSKGQKNKTNLKTKYRPTTMATYQAIDKYATGQTSHNYNLTAGI